MRSGPKIKLSHHNQLHVHGSHVLITMTEYIQATVDIRAQLGTFEEGKPRHYPGRDADINGKGQRYTQCAHGPSVCGQTLRAARELSLFERKTRKSFQAKVASLQKGVRECYAFEDAHICRAAVEPSRWYGISSFSLLVRYIVHQRLYFNNTMQIGKPYHMHNK